MQPYDIGMVILLVGATLFGVMKGMAWQIASIASVAVSSVIALRFSDRLAPMFGEQAPLNRFIAMLAIYLGTSMAVWIVFRFVAGAIDRVKLREFDRQAGAIFGAAKGILLCVVVTFFAVTLSDNMREQVLASKSGTYIARLINWADPIMPREVHQVLDPYLDRLENELQPGERPETDPEAPFQIPGIRLGRGADDSASPTDGGGWRPAPARIVD